MMERGWIKLGIFKVGENFYKDFFGEDIEASQMSVSDGLITIDCFFKIEHRNVWNEIFF